MGKAAVVAACSATVICAPLALQAAGDGVRLQPERAQAGGTTTGTSSTTTTGTGTGTSAGLAAAPVTTVAAAAPAAATTTGGAKAFPTAEGFGKISRGGRGGIICQVTTLADTGAGSLRDCLTRTGPRTVVFRVGGTITVNSTIRAGGQVTIAGQTAPGGGIQIRNGSNVNSAVQFIGNDVIVRHIRFAPGPLKVRPDNNNDAIFFEGERAIFDHVSARWATDENVDVYGKTTNRDITVQWSLVAEPLMGAVAYPGAHAYCLMSAGQRVSVLYTMMQDCYMRGPNSATNRFEMINSVVHNWNERSLDIYARFGAVELAAVGNFWAMGASSIKNWGNTPIRLNAGNSVGGALADYRLYVAANRSWATPTDGAQNAIVPLGERPAIRATPPFALGVTPVSAEQAWRDVTSFAGAFPRDAADTRIVNEARTCSGAVLKNESQIAGGWPTLASGTPYPDADKDGMDDRWESARKLTDPNADADRDGYTNLEEFLNELAGDQDAQGNTLTRVGKGTGTVPAVNCGIKV